MSKWKLSPRITITLEVVRLYCNALVPSRFPLLENFSEYSFCDSLECCLRFLFHLLNPLKTAALQLHFHIREQSEVERCQISQIELARDWFGTLRLWTVPLYENEVEGPPFWDDWGDSKGIASSFLGCHRNCIQKNFPAVENEVWLVHCSTGGLLWGW